jgi:antirestriction protein ArdC
MSVYESITSQIVQAIEQGAGEFTLPWHRPSQNFRPINAATRKVYNGVNVVALWAAAQNRGYDSGTWATYKQWASVGAQVRHGEKASAVVFYRELEARDDNAEDETPRAVARASFVFAAEQVQNYQQEASAAQAPAVAVERDKTAEDFVSATEARISHTGTRAFFRPSTDEIVLPPREAFIGSPTSTPTESFYATVLHELAHWTGAEHRLARSFGKRFGDAAYAAEELTAELAAAFLCADLSITNRPRVDHAQYLSSWLDIMKADSRAIFATASAASRAADYLHSLQPRAEIAA